MTILENLDKEIARLQKELEGCEPTSEKYDGVAFQLNRLHKLRMDEVKHEDDVSAQTAQVERELMKESEETERYEQERIDRAKDQNRSFWMRAAELGVPIMFYGAWIFCGFWFESEGSFTSATFKNFMKHLKPTRK